MYGRIVSQPCGYFFVQISNTDTIQYALMARYVMSCFASKEYHL